MLDIATHGDQYEQIAYKLFLRDKFPAYETFWQNFIAPLTNRPVDVHTKSDQELALQFPTETKEKIHERIAVMQLHYSVLRMLIKAYDKRKLAETDMSAVEDLFSYLYSALDIAAELFGRYQRIKDGILITVSAFEPSVFIENAKQVRREWQKKYKYPPNIEDIRKYRNLMLHGPMFGSMMTAAAKLLILPKPEEIEKYSDWRKIGESFHSSDILDFLHSVNIVNPAIEEVVSYLNSEWKSHLI